MLTPEVPQDFAGLSGLGVVREMQRLHCQFSHTEFRCCVLKIAMWQANVLNARKSGFDEQSEAAETNS